MPVTQRLERGIADPDGYDVDRDVFLHAQIWIGEEIVVA